MRPEQRREREKRSEVDEAEAAEAFPPGPDGLSGLDGLDGGRRGKRTCSCRKWGEESDARSLRLHSTREQRPKPENASPSGTNASVRMRHAHVPYFHV
jgi:hypothetical protein